MLFNSFSFLIFFPIVVLVYFAIPKKVRWIWLLISSYYFYMNWNAVYGMLLLASTFVTWIVGRLVERYRDKRALCKGILVAGIIIDLGVLAYYKYFSFLAANLNIVLSKSGVSFAMPVFDIILPVGISFYTFQALGYSIDVYRGDIKAEKNFFRYALFVSFFPQLVAGPIERSTNLLRQLKTETTFNYENMRRGLCMMAWGYYLKLVVADNATIVIDTVYGDISRYSGWYLVVATILFAFQIYGDFGGYSMIAIGAAKVMGFDIMENFNAPYMAQSVTEFWHRWHVSLSQWFRDYLYIPLGGNRKSVIRKYINVMIVFLVSGLWHGASWSFVIWGGLNGLFQVIEGVFKKSAERILNALKIDTASHCFIALKVLVTFALVDFTWLFFRAQSAGKGVAIIKGMLFGNNPWVLFDGALYGLGLSQKALGALFLAIAFLMFYDYKKVRGVNLIDWVLKQQFVFRLMIYVIFVGIILVFGAWGGGYSENTFLYFQF